MAQTLGPALGLCSFHHGLRGGPTLSADGRVALMYRGYVCGQVGLQVFGSWILWVSSTLLDSTGTHGTYIVMRQVVRQQVHDQRLIRQAGVAKDVWLMRRGEV